MSTLETIYTAGLRLGAPLLPLLSHGEGKLARGIRGRRGACERLAAWARDYRDPSRPLVWFHAPSVGEGLQARAVLAALLELRPDIQTVYTYFSPSAVLFAGSVPADITGYLPLDLPSEMRGAVEALQPSAIVFSKTEVWPNLTRAAESRGTGLLLLSATLPASSSRLRQPTRRFLAPAHRRLLKVGAISAGDAKRFEQLGVPADRIEVTGDARFDQVVQRARSVDRGSTLLTSLLSPDELTIVAGSTWPEDETHLIPAIAAARSAGYPVRAVIAPHEPTPEHLTELEQRLKVHGLSSGRLADVAGGSETNDIVVIDRVGILGELYALADVAYVGGGFGTAGIHSVLEPAAFGAPVLFGPRNSNAREAAELVAVGGAFQPSGTADLTERLTLLLSDPVVRKEAGEAARAYVESGLGAAERSARLILAAIASR